MTIGDIVFYWGSEPFKRQTENRLGWCGTD